MELLVWSLTLTLTLIGVVGVIVPLLPGTTLVFLAMVLHKLLLPGAISWTALGWIGAVWFLSVLVDFAGVLIGTRLFGGTRWGMVGASGGAFVGMFFSLPALVLGTIFGAVVAERYAARRTHRQALQAGAGAAFGFVISTVGRLGCALLMVLMFVYAVSAPRWPDFGLWLR